MPEDPLDNFSAPVAAWFRDVFAQPTPVQSAAWQAISAGDNALVVAPTGSGKTLAAFLWSLSRLTSSSFLCDATAASAGSASAGTRVLYVSPLKALGVDVDRNLSAPLAGIARMASALGEPVAPVRVGVRSGDTPASERAKLLRNPPEILITTPESLYLMLTSKAAGTLTGVETVIIDEIHAVAGTKRGTHLAVSLERLEMLCGRAVQRIGLSATVNPVDTVASFLGGDRPVTVVNPPQEKKWDVRVTSVVEDFQNPPEGEAAQEPVDPAPVDDALAGPELIGEGAMIPQESALPQQRSVWPHVNKAVYAQVMANRSTLVFVNSRRAAERLTGALNELWAAEHDPDSLAAPTRRDPAQLMAQSTTLRGAPSVIARAHHGSVSKDERADIEAALKSGDLKCVVATSSLELGIDMGLVDHVVQVGAPPSVEAAVQRCGRAGHSVGAVSRATVYPLHKQDAETATVVVDKMLKGELEPLEVITNALDVLAQQTVAAAVQAGQAGQVLDVEAWWHQVRRSHPYAALPREAFDGVVELISGHYPSTDFADLKPRVVYDPVAGTLEPRPGTQRVAVTSGGTIPDRGMFGVFLAAGEETGARRVGELDEEMVYESRVGDIFTLGASSWRILEINRDQVIVAPAAGHTGRLPFWVGDAEGRPVELGQAIGEHRRAWGTGQLEDLRGAAFIDANTVANLDAFYGAQKEEAGIVPDEKTILIERFRDEIGDWRVVIHTPYGRGVNAPWALALSAQLQRDTGIDAMAVAGDDGLVLRLPYSDEPPGLDLVLGEESGQRRADAAQADVMESVGSSALFAARFRECAARSLLLPRRNPGKRQPLWQQRQRAAQLLDVARNHPQFPVMVETMRECIHDVYKLDELRVLLTSLGGRGDAVRVAEVTTDAPSAFAESLLFTYTAAFMYEGDSADRAAALAVDPALLAKVLGKSGEGIVLDPAVIEQVVAAAQHLAEGRKATTVEQAVDMLRALGPLTEEAIAARTEGVDIAELRELIPRQIAEVSFGGAVKLAVVEDMPLLRDGLGVPVPPGVAASADFVGDATDQLLLRWMRGRGPVVPADVAAEFGLGAATAQSLLARWVGDRRLESGQFTAEHTQYVDVGMLRRLRSATLAAARGAVEPVSQATFAEFLGTWHGLGAMQREDLMVVLEQLAGVAMPASAWETVVLPSRIPDYAPRDLDELLASGDVLAIGSGQAGSNDVWVSLVPADLVDIEALQQVDQSVGMVATQIADALAAGGAFLATELAGATGIAQSEVDQALWELFDAGWTTPDTLAPIRARLAEAGSTGKAAHRAPRRGQRRVRMGRRSFAQTRPSRPAASRVPGRWAATPAAHLDPAEQAMMHGEAWIERYAVVTRGAIMAEKATGGFAEAYRNLSAWEDTGIVLRGYIVEGLGGAQFAPREVIEQLRQTDQDSSRDTVHEGGEIHLLAAVDPANPYGAALPWPAHPEDAPAPSRSAGALVLLCGGRALAYLTRGGKNITTFTRDAESAPARETIAMVVEGLAVASHNKKISPVTIEKINGHAVLETDTRAWQNAGAWLTPKGLKI